MRAWQVLLPAAANCDKIGASMFSQGFKKTAVAVVTMSPEEYFHTVGEKDALVGALSGAAAGTLHGLRKGPKGSKAKYGLIGNAVGAAAGGVAGHYGGKALRHHQTNKVYRLSSDLKLRSTPSRSAYSSQEEA